MIDPIGTSSPLLPETAAATPQAGDGKFDAALKAAQAAAQRSAAHDSERAAIVEKGFSAWVRDTKMDQLKEKLRKMVMAEMGVDADSLNRLDAAMRQILEKKIEEEVQRRMAEAAQDENGDGTAAQQQPAGKKDQGGISCPVIPALVWPGGGSLS